MSWIWKWQDLDRVDLDLDQTCWSSFNTKVGIPVKIKITLFLKAWMSLQILGEAGFLFIYLFFNTIFCIKPYVPTTQKTPNNHRLYKHGIWYIYHYHTLPGLKLSTCSVTREPRFLAKPQWWIESIISGCVACGRRNRSGESAMVKLVWTCSNMSLKKSRNTLVREDAFRDSRKLVWRISMKNCVEGFLECVGCGHRRRAATARVWTLPTFGNPIWTRQILCSEVIFHYHLVSTIFSNPAAPLAVGICRWFRERLDKNEDLAFKMRDLTKLQ